MIEIGTIFFTFLTVISFLIKPQFGFVFSLPLLFYYFPYKFLFYLIPFYPLLDFFIRNSFPPFSSIWDEAFIFLLILIFLLRSKTQKIKFTEIIYPVFVFLFVLLLSSYFTKIDTRIAFDGIRSYLEMFLFFLIVVNFIDDKKDVEIFINLSSISLLFLSLYGIYQYIARVPIPSSWVDKDLEVTISTRAYSIFGSPNAFAGYLILLIPLIFTMFLSEKKLIKKLYYLFVLGLSLFALLFTLTRAAQISIIFSFLLFTLLYKDKRYFLVLIFFIIIAFSIPQIRIRFLNLLSPIYLEKAKTYGRLFRWNLAIMIFSLKPIFGVGPGGFGGAVASRLGMFEGLYVDNYYLKTLVETGFVGFISFIYLIFSILRKGVSNLINLKNEKEKMISLGIFLGLVAFFLNNITENLWEIPILSATMWSLVSILFSFKKE
ncbi:MAG: O-antigen ligase family protein [Caldisericia bacterium]|jgi:O-antigen ligase|nr:O-antigen ligase family protein [Caldisericia bacterium]